MKLSQTFEAERPLAQHCAELLATRGPRPEERAESIAAWRRDVGMALVQEFAGLFSGGQIKAALGEPEWLTGADVFARIGPIAANSLLRCGDDSRTLLLSFDFATAIALTDRSFGGEGAVGSAPVESLPRSAALLIDQAAGHVAQAIATASQTSEGSTPRGDVIVRSESAARLKPFGPDIACALFEVSFTEADRPSWTALLAIADDRLDNLLPGMGAPVPTDQRGADPAVFGAIPLPLRAVLSEFDLSLGRLERLKPGDTIPIAVPREIPLQLGPQVFAHGLAGTQEDRLALSITRTNAAPHSPIHAQGARS